MLRCLTENKTISSPKPPQDYMAQHRQQATTEYNLCHSQLRVMENSVFRDSSLLWFDAVVRRIAADVSKHSSASTFRVV